MPDRLRPTPVAERTPVRFQVPAQEVVLRAAGTFTNPRGNEFPVFSGDMTIDGRARRLCAIADHDGKLNPDFLIPVDGLLVALDGYEFEDDGEVLGARLPGYPDEVAFQVPAQEAVLVWMRDRHMLTGGMHEGEVQTSFGALSCTQMAWVDEEGVGGRKGSFGMSAGAANYMW
jgi:hypothetical protein